MIQLKAGCTAPQCHPPQHTAASPWNCKAWSDKGSSTDWQQTEQLSKVAKHDPNLEHQPQPNSSAYLLSVPFGKVHIFSLLALCPVVWEIVHFCWLCIIGPCLEHRFLSLFACQWAVCRLLNTGVLAKREILWNIQALFFCQSSQGAACFLIVLSSLCALWLPTGCDATSRLLSKMLPLSTNHLAKCEFCFSGGNHYGASQKSELQIARAQTLLDWGVCTGAWLKKEAWALIGQLMLGCQQ